MLNVTQGLGLGEGELTNDNVGPINDKIAQLCTMQIVTEYVCYSQFTKKCLTLWTPGDG